MCAEIKLYEANLEEGLPEIPEGWVQLREGVTTGTDKVLENGKWVSLVDIALETNSFLGGLPVENFKLPVIKKIC